MKKHWPWISLIVLVTILVYGLISRNRLPFRTIERVDSTGTGSYWVTSDPGLQILVNDYDAATSYLPISSEAHEMVLDVDFDDYFVIIAYAGRQESGHEGIEIQRIIRHDDRVEIYTKMGNPTSDAAMISPYHIVMVKKKGDWDQMVNFKLYLNGEEIVVLSKIVS